MSEAVNLGRHLAVGWLAIPFLKKIAFVRFLGDLLKTAAREKHIFPLRNKKRKQKIVRMGTIQY